MTSKVTLKGSVCNIFFKDAFFNYNYSVKKQRLAFKYLIFFTTSMTAIFAGFATDSIIRGENDPLFFYLSLNCSFFAGLSLGILGMGILKHKIQEEHTRGEISFDRYLLAAKDMQEEQKETESLKLS